MLRLEMADSSTSEPNVEVMQQLVANRPLFLRFLIGRLGDEALAQDILQEAFVKGLANPQSLPSDGAATAWFYRVLRNAVIDGARRRKSASIRLTQLAAEMQAHDEQPERAAQVCPCVGRLAHTLKPEYAEAVQRIEVEGMSVKEFAVHAGISANNAAVRAFRAREALRAQVVSTCGACAASGCVDCTCGHG